jgi:Tfp pilus assembly protein PilO
MNRRLLIPIGIGVVLVLFWYVALWGPTNSALADARKRTNDAAQKTASLQDQIKNLQASQAGQPLKQSQLETLRVAIPDQPNLAQFILDANDAASTAGVDFLSITPTPPTGQGQSTATTAAGGSAAATGGATPVPIRVGMTVSGGYFQVLDFMNRLNKLSRIVVIDSVSMTSQAGGTGAAAGGAISTDLNVSLSERIFTTSPQAVSGSSSSSSGGVTTTTAPGGTTTTSTTRAGGG